MSKVFLIHGFEGAPNGGWRPWLMGELDKKDIYACALPMPRPYAPQKHEWVAEIARAVENVEGEAIYLVGHSLGVPAILQYLKDAKSIAGAVLVSGPYKKTGVAAIDSFFEPALDLPSLKEKARRFVIIHGDNDSLVPLSQGQELADGLGGELIVIQNGGHLNGSSGFRELPEARDALLQMMQ
jgi:predicted alpha/beta hydrolase family esterase